MTRKKRLKLSETHKNRIKQTQIARSRAGLSNFVVDRGVCPHCGANAQRANIVRWHLDNCKYKWSAVSKLIQQRQKYEKTG